MVNSEYHRIFICCFPNLGASRDSSHSDLAPLGSRAVTLPKPVKAERSRAEPNRGNTSVNYCLRASACTCGVLIETVGHG